MSKSKDNSEASNKHNLSVLDIFCGAGGFSEGFKQAGYSVLGGVDNDRQAIGTYAFNFPMSSAIEWDLSVPLTECEKANALLDSKIDVVVGGPPCQGFSIAGKRDADDPRNRLFEAYFEIIKKTKPKAVVIENVPTMLTMNGGAFLLDLVSGLEKLGYNVEKSLLWSDQYGVPQKRKRLIIVALNRKIAGKCFVYPKPTDKKVTCWDALHDLPLLDDELGADVQAYPMEPKNAYQSLMRKGAKFLHNHWAVQHTEQTKRVIAMVPDGGNYKNLPKSLWMSRKVNIAWTRMKSDAPCFTIDAGHNHHFHYKANRVPTVRECARIQSFPDTFVFLGNKTSQFRQVGNAVPPLLAKAVAMALIGNLE